MDFEELLKLATRPPLYEKGTASIWDDEYISKHLLEAHINPDSDMASRKKTTIEKTVDWILNKAGKSNMDILDLGCGPGLYAELMAVKGHRVTGVDFSKRSIDYAKKQATGKNLDINYLYKNYLELDIDREFDLAIMIYCDFVALLPQERTVLLANVRRTLKPSGSFIFDVLNDSVLEGKTDSRECRMESEGFWSNEPYMILSDSLLYPENKVILDQHIVMDESGSHKIYRFWHHYFAPEDLQEELGRNGFTEVECYDNVLPDDDPSGDIVTFCKAS